MIHVSSIEQRPWRLRSRIGRLAVGVCVSLVVVAGVAWSLARPAKPAAFYGRALPAGAAPGTLIDREPFTRSIPAGAHAWRYLYATTRGGRVVVASAVALLPSQTGAERPVVAWAHGTTGMVAGCAPSTLEKPFDNVPDIGAIVRSGWVYVGTDYPGLGTSGGHAYLIGEDAAHAVLDAVRAARKLPDAGLGAKVVLWGHSQGGNATLWSGMQAAKIAPELHIAGVAALAPASDLKALVAATKSGIFGKIVASYLIAAYARAYPDVDVASYLGTATRLVAGDIASRCIEGYQTRFSAMETKLLPRDGIFTRDPASGPLGDRLAQNTPAGPIVAPLLIAQGEADDLVLPDIQKRFVAQQCAAGQPVDFRSYAGRNHISLVAPDSPLAGELMQWTRDRFEGRPGNDTCRR